MQRQLYLALLLVTTALAAAVCLRPSLGDELIRLAGLQGGSAGHYAGSAGPPAEAHVSAVGTSGPLAPRTPGAQSVPWPATPVGEALASDADVGLPASPPRYSSYSQVEDSYSQAQDSYRPEVARRPQAPPFGAEMPIPAEYWGGEASTPPPGPTYPVAGAARNALRARAAPGWEQGPVPPVDPVNLGSGPAAARAEGPPFAADEPRYPPAADRLAAPLGGAQPSPEPARPGAGSPAIARARPCQGTEVLGRAGNEWILASEVLPAYSQIMGRVPQNELDALPKDRLDLEKKALIARLLEGPIQTKLIYQDAKRTLPEERLPEIEKKIADHFVKEELPKRIEKAGVATAAELDEKLRAMGSSLERMRRGYVQQALAMSWLDQQRGADPKVSHAEMLDYYREHLADYETPARARWEKMSVQIPRYSDGREAYAALARMGNEVKQGPPMAEVVAAQPKGGPECQGGVQGWVTQGGMEVSDTIEEGIFALPVGQLSRIFREGGAYHIIRVLQREEFKRTPFEDPEIQKEIRDKIAELRHNEQTEEYLARLREQFPVWTIFDDDPQLAQFRRRMDSSRN